jgi:surfeit locus 1 family protein
VPADNATTNAWFSRDPALYARTYGVTGTIAPYIIDADFDAAVPGGIPQGGETIVDFPNSHLGYAITWFGLALCCAGVFIAFAWGRLTGKA